MKKLTTIITIMLLSGTAHCQRGFGNIHDRIVNKATQRASDRTDRAIDKGLDRTEEVIDNAANGNGNQANSNQANQSNTGHAPAGSHGDGQDFKAYNNYDFIPGDRIIFEDEFTDDQYGEFPSHWNLGAGQGVMNKIGDHNALLLTAGNYAHVCPLIKGANYLSDTFTIEFDSYTTGGYEPHLFFYGSNADAMSASNDLASVNINWSGVEVTTHGGVDLSGTYPAAIAGENYYNKWHHVAIAYRNHQMKVYVDQYRVLTVPNLPVSPRAFDIEGIGDEATPVIMSNFRVANGGGMNVIGKKFTENKIVTHGINFDIDKSTIKPESMGTLNMIVQVMKDNPDLKFEVDGHTDNSGSSAHNLTLSQQRADAVKAQLISMGIDASRLSTKGFGDSKPVSDNNTFEGKAGNRRVEFVKI